MIVKEHLLKGARSVRDWVNRHWALDVRTVRGREHWRAGIELVWHPFDLRTERSFISHVETFGETVLFLVRDHRDYIQSHFLSGHFYAEDELELIKAHYKGNTFLDVGANVGNHALFAAKILRAPRVIAVEPFPSAYRILRCNIALNDLSGAIEHLAVALSDHEGRGSMSATPGNLGLAEFEEGPGNIRLARGDDLFSDEQVGFVKVDVEGAEMRVLKGLEQTIRRCRPPMMVEVDDTNIEAFQAFCREIGYVVAVTRKPYRANTYFLVLPD